jgi:peptidoglycan/LPS O-acetylase OafA/YrhL
LKEFTLGRPSYLPYIDGLRAVAVVLVLIFHAFPKALPGGFIGVDIFFVISGFLITRIILSKDFSFFGFYARRAQRLFPALAVVLFASLIAGWHLLTPAQLEELGRQVLASVLFVPNWLFWSETGYFDAAAHTKPLLHLWSLGVEEQFYLMGPALLVLAAKYRIRAHWVLLGVTWLSLLSLAYFKLMHPSPAFVFYLPFCRAWEISAGGFLALVVFPNRETSISTAGVLLGVSVILFGSLHIDGSAGWPNRWTLLVVIGSLLIIYFGAGSKFASRTLGSTPVVFIGKLSYPLYLWHWPILTFLYLRKGTALSSTEASLALVASLLLAAFTYLAIEKPLKSHIRLKYLALSTTSILVLLGLSGLAITLAHGVSSRLPTTLQEAMAYEHYDYASDAYNPGCWLENEEPTAKLLPICIKTDRKDIVAVWGDSHAARLSPGLRKVFGEERISQLTRNGCAPLLDLPSPPASGKECSNGNSQILDILRRDKPKTLILFGAWQNYTMDWRPHSKFAEMLLNTIQQIKAAGIDDIIVVGPAPRFIPSLPAMIVKSWSIHQWTRIPDRIHMANDDTIEMDREFADLLSSQQVSYISLVHLFCNNAGCLTKRPGSDSDLLTWDYGHLTTTGAILVAQDIRRARQHML